MNHMVLVLKRTDAQEQALTTLLDQLHDPKSPMYHQWLQPGRVRSVLRRVGRRHPGADDVSSELSASRSNEVSPGRSTVIFSGNAGQVRQAFHTEIHNYSVNGENHVANSTDPSIPSTLAGMVAGFRSLNNFQAKPQRHEVGGFVKDKSTGAWKQAPQASAKANDELANNWVNGKRDQPGGSIGRCATW